MIPPLIVARAIEVGLDIIAITDHNSAENAEAVMQAAQGTALKVLPGMECETVEGVHMVCIFDEVSAALALQEQVYAKLPDLPNRPETFGAQFVVDKEGEFIRYNDRLLLVPSELSIEGIWQIAQDLGGLAFPAHVDRSAYGIYGVLGFMPSHPVFPAVEISSRITAEDALRKYPDLSGKRLFRCSDAHRLSEIGAGKTMLELKHRTAAEIRMMSRE